MKTLSHLIILIALIGCNEAERSMLPDTVVEYAFNNENTRVPVPAFEEQDSYPDVISPIPNEIQDALFGTWLEVTEDLEHSVHISASISADVSLDGYLWSYLVKEPIPAHSLSVTLCQTYVDNRLYYDKYLDAGGIVIISASERTSLSAPHNKFLYWTRDIILTMTSKMPELRQVMSPQNKFRYVQVRAGFYDVTLPQELSKISHSYFASAGMGVGGMNRYYNEIRGEYVEVLSVSTVVHEFAHTMRYAFRTFPHLFPGFDARLEALYENAVQKAQTGKGFFYDPSAYALINRSEYWAVATSKWFRKLHGENNLAHEYQLQLMQSEDPGLYLLLAEVFPIVHLPTYLPEDFNK